ncbi:hypothetical protein DOM21_05895 [Bacteriovorax stolpii]|uniref:Uncharacterized protein n=1 Tax=Bacteriovorax stolpii TaxID=960 RepID=A0A2K9NU14_BACTC|nr:S8 family peptidase [Bacteriovorax stolpii]AUN99011.1 hypothetical protein C0V70_13045 [Bacteriovorax stolpii]QDK40993.1 hypothetical protein DOM21_05895 [Bacteriovorax stolpii]TDP55464.1 subtilase family protein [Bacteriovorax stolpii]
MKLNFLLLALFSFFTATALAKTFPAKPEFDGYIIKFKQNASKRVGLHLKSFGVDSNVAETSFGTFAKIDKLPSKNSKDKSYIPSGDIEYVEPNWVVYKLDFFDPVFPMKDEYFREQWGLDYIGYTKLAAKQNSKKIKVAVIDTGVDYRHEDLQGQILINEAEANGEPDVDDDGNGHVDDIYGFDFENDDGDPMDDNAHGTHCAGVIAARHNSTGIAGLLPEGQILPIKILNAQGRSTVFAVVKAIDYAISRGVHIISNSYGSPEYSRAEEQAIKRADARGIVFVAAAGNEDSDNDSVPVYPANYDVPNIISVGAIDDVGKITDFSNYGRTTVDILAPGYEILSTIPNHKYTKMNGTSMATPLVAGMAGLLLDKNMTLSPAEVRKAIIDGGVSWGRPAQANEGRSIGGIANIGYSLNSVKSAYFSLEGSVAHSSSEASLEVSYKLKVENATLNANDLQLVAKYIKGNTQVEEYFDVGPGALTDTGGGILLEDFTNEEIFDPNFNPDINIEIYYKHRKLAEKKLNVRGKTSSLRMIMLESSLEKATAKVLIKYGAHENAELKIQPGPNYESYEIESDDVTNGSRNLVVIFKGLNKKAFTASQIFFESILIKESEIVGASKVQLVFSSIQDVSFEYIRVSYAYGTVGFKYVVYVPESLDGAHVKIDVFNEKTSGLIYSGSGFANNVGLTFVTDTENFGIDGWQFVGRKWFGVNDPINLIVKTYVDSRLIKTEKYPFPSISLDNLTVDHAITYFRHLVQGRFDLDSELREKRMTNMTSILAKLNDEEVKSYVAQKLNPYDGDSEGTILGKLILDKFNTSNKEPYKKLGEALEGAASNFSIFKRSAYKKLIKELKE